MNFTTSPLSKEKSISGIEKYFNGNGILNNETISLQNNNTLTFPKKQKAIPFVIFQDNKFQIPEEAKNLLTEKEYANIGIISLVGKYRTGKSFLLNRVILNTQQSSGFGVGATFKPCTKGIWIWSDPLIINNSNCTKTFPCFLIDTEGLGAYDEEINHDSKIFLIAIIISSLFIFNSFGAIDETSINSLSFVLNLSKIIKIKSLTHDDNEEELAEYFPSFLWLLRDFSLKLEDLDGNIITEKQYLENALENKIGDSEIIKEKNRVRNLIKTYFPDRDCFTMVRPVEKESDLQNLQNLPDDMLRKEFLEQAQNFRDKVYKIACPKSFHKRPLSGSMLIELVQNILDSINSGAIPVIENTWKYVVQNECIKNTQNLTDKFVEEIRKYRELNKNDKDFGKNMKNFTKNLYKKYVDDFMKNDLIDEENKKEFVEKLKKKLNKEMNIFDKENEKLFENNFETYLNDLGEQFLKDLIEKEKNNKYFDFFLEFDNFRQKANQLSPDFPHKSDIIYDKVIEILRKYVQENINKKKKINEEELSKLKNENAQQKNILNDLKKEIDNNQKQNIENENKIKEDIKDIKNKNKEIEKEIDEILNNKKKDEQKFKNDVMDTKNKYEIKIKEIINNQNNQNAEINLKNEQLNLMKINNEKLMKLHQKKFDYYENEVKKLREKYDILLKETEMSENQLNENRNNLLNMNNKIKRQKYNSDINRNESNKYQNEVLTNDLNDFMNYIQDNLMKQNEQNKSMMDKIIKNKEKDCIKDKQLYDNFKNIKKRNEELKTKININENKINLLQEQLNNLTENKNIIKNMKKFKCKNCNKNFEYQDFLFHSKICQKNDNLDNSNDIYNDNNINESKKSKKKINDNTNSSYKVDPDFDPDRLKIKIIKGEVKNDELNKPYLDYIINVNYDNTKNWQIHKKFYDFANLYNAINNSYREIAQFPMSLSNIFEDLNSKSSFNINKIQQLEKFINEVAHTDIINTSKSFLKFIELEQNFHKKEKGISYKSNFENKSYSSNRNKKSKKSNYNNSNNNKIFKENKYNKYNNYISNDDEENYYPMPGINNRYINSYLINKKKHNNNKYNDDYDDKDNDNDNDDDYNNNDDENDDNEILEKDYIYNNNYNLNEEEEQEQEEEDF